MIIEKDWLRTENWCIPRRHGNIMSDEFTPYPKNPLIQQFFANIGRTVQITLKRNASSATAERLFHF